MAKIRKRPAGRALATLRMMSPSPRTKPKRNALLIAFVLGTASAAAVIVLVNSPIIFPASSQPRYTIQFGRAAFISVLTGTLITVLVWLLIELRARVFRPPGSCRQCGYDRMGLVAGVPCPECGSGEPPVA